MNVQTAYTEFLLSCQADGVRPKTYSWYQTMLKPLLQQFGQESLTQITTSQLRQYIVDLRNRESRYTEGLQKPKQPGGLADASLNGYIRAAHRFWRWASMEYAIPNPMQTIKRPQKYKVHPRVLSLTDWIKLVKVLEPTLEGYRDHAILALLADTGCRAGGILSLQLPYLNLDQRYAFVTEKGNKRRKLHFTRYTAHTLHIWLAERPPCGHPSVFTSFSRSTYGRPLSYEGLYHLLKRLGKRAGITGPVNPHAFRHGFAHQYLHNGGDLSSVSRLMGHTSIAVTDQFYAAFTPDELDDRHDRYSPLAQIEQHLTKKNEA